MYYYCIEQYKQANEQNPLLIAIKNFYQLVRRIDVKDTTMFLRFVSNRF